MTSSSATDKVEQAAHAALTAQTMWSTLPRAQRATALRALADALITHRERLVAVADAETSLGLPRLNGEVERTAFQLRAFADAVDSGKAWQVIDDAAVAGAPPVGRPRLLRIQQALGPVAMFAASNFPFAFSVLGGDTASALAAGCTVVVKAHPGHPELSRQVFDVAQTTLAQLGLPAGVLSMVEGGIDVGQGLVRHPAMAAVAFTGSLRGGQALWREVQQRPNPIPFYGELGSINPVVVLPQALRESGESLAAALAASITMGSGQFCTSPGLIVIPADAEFDGFVSQLASALAAITPHAMLTPAIRQGFEDGVARWRGHSALQCLTPAGAADAPTPTPVLAQVQAKDVIADAHLCEEVFGPAALVVRSVDVQQTIDLLKAIQGSLTVTVWGAEHADEKTQALVNAAQNIAGRVLFAGVPTGVAVCAAQQHGGPWPASTAAQTTSVGMAALERFLRPVALQDPPLWVLQREGLTQ